MGAFGEVFLAKFNQETVAIKTLKQISESNVIRFRGEMVLIKALMHPNIVKYMGCIWDEEMIGLMLEVRSSELRNYELRKQGIVPNNVNIIAVRRRWRPRQPSWR